MAEVIERGGATELVPRLGVGRLLDRVATGFTMLGGLTFCALIVMSIVSIVGRKLFAAPVQGDVELMQMGAAVGAAAFLPLCELYDHNVKVDALTGWVSARGRAVLDTVAHALLTVAAVLITWRTALAAIDGYSSGEVSTLLTVPMWLPVALLVPSFALLALCGLYRTGRSLREAMGRAS
ncbi:MAG: TRAP transporter small permease [Sphaerotilus sp.]|nr:TRAP transporter small permease [Sphaerotilus sp.]